MSKISFHKPGRKAIRNLIIFGVIFLLLLAALLYIRFQYEIISVTVTGNEHYTEEEIKNLVFDKKYKYNSVILWLDYYNKSVENIPFIERMDVDIVTPQKVRINVYEKAVAGYVEYLGHYMYFDKDGIVVESSTQVMEGIPFVTGLNFDHVVLHDTLPVKDNSVFLLILNITQLLNKYEIKTDRIAFDSNGNMTLYFGDARVSLGDDAYIDEKINEMHLLLPELEGYAGTLHMENYSGEDTNFSFDKDEKLNDEESENNAGNEEETASEGSVEAIEE